MKVWVLHLVNIEDNSRVELYSTYEKARTAFENYAYDNADKDEFEKTDDYILWFDPDYNSHSSYIFMYEDEVI